MNNFTTRNPVAQHLRTFNKATVEQDRKRKSKADGQRKTKHKGANYGNY